MHINVPAVSVLKLFDSTAGAQPAMELFRFGPPHVDDLAVSLLAGLVVLVVLELIKPSWRAGFSR